MTVASVDTATGTVTLVPASRDMPAGRLAVLAPFLDVQAVLADRARHVAFEQALVDAVRWAE